jgi:predicted dehydrogenase
MLVALRASGLCRAVAGCDLDSAKRQAAQDACPELFVTDEYEAMLARDDVKIVAIYTPDAMHAKHVEQAFRAGKHVICTKPLLNDPSDADRLRRVASETGMRLQVGQSTRFGEPFQRQREDFERGIFGEPEVVDAHYNHRMDWYYKKSPWTVTDTHWAYLGLSHPVDLVCWYLGPIASVHAVGTVTSLGSEFRMKTPDAISVNLVARSGRLGRVLGNYGFHELPRARSLIECLLMGSKGTSLARYPELRYTFTGENGAEVDEDYEHAFAGFYYRHELKGMHYGEFCNYADYFASKLLTGERNSPDLEEGLETVSVMRAIVESLEHGQVVRL